MNARNLTLRSLLLYAVSLLTGVVALAPSAAQAATYYVATDGSNFFGNGSSTSPWATIGYGIGRLAGGDTLIVRAGTYTDLDNFINARLTPIPSGQPGAYTTIRAEMPYSVRIRNAGTVDYYDNMIRVTGSYIHVDGFILDLRDTADPEFVADLGGDYNKLTRTIIKRVGRVNQYGGWLQVNGSYNLVEDVAGVGAARYGFATGGPDSTDHHIIFRRVVGRFDFSPSSQPKATFNAYGTNSGWGVHHVVYQNCIAIDGQRGPDSGERHYGAWYFPKNMDNAYIVGSIALNNAVAYSGMFVQELQGRGTQVINSVSWGNTGGSGIRWNGTGSMLADNVTVGAHPAGALTNSGGAATVSDSLLLNGPVYQTNDGGPLTYTNNITTASLLHIVSSPVAQGAHITRRIGASGTLWGETGWDQETTEPLWPFPYESEIKAVFSEPNTPASGNTPSSNNTTRGFAAPGTDQWGQPITLTRYIWQYLGNQIPTSVYGTGRSLAAPTGVSVTPVP